MRVTNVWDRTADVATWTANGRLCAVAAKSDDSVIVVATATKADNVQGDGAKILVKRSTDGGVTFGASITAIDVSAQSGTPACEMPTLVWDSRNNRLHLWCLSTIGLTAGQSWYTNTAPILRSYSDDNGLTWSAPVQFSSGFNSQWVTSGGEYDATSGRLIICAAGRSGAGQPMSPFTISSTDGVTWTAGALIDTTLDQGEHKVLAEGANWYSLTRTTGPTPRVMYVSTNYGASWSAVRNAYPLPEVQVNLGFARMGTFWLYSSPMTYAPYYDGTDTSSPRRQGALLKSRDKGRSWASVARLTNENTTGTARFFAYSDIKTTANFAYAVYETDNYAKVNLAVLTKAELGN